MAAAVKLIEQLRDDIDLAEYELLHGWRSEGVGWPEIGMVYGLSGEAVRQRFRRLRPP